MDIVTIMGFAAAIHSLSKLVYTTGHQNDTHEKTPVVFLSLSYSLFALGTLLWFLFGLFSHNYPVTIANCITLIFAAIILGYKVKYG